MPFMDGSGPIGAGPMTGRGLGRCTNSKYSNKNIRLGGGLSRGLGRGLRRGLGLGIGLNCLINLRNFEVNDNTSIKEILQQQKDILEEKLKAINEKLKEE